MGACSSTLKNKKYEKPSKKGMLDDRIKNKEFDNKLAFLEKVPLFSRLAKPDLPVVAGALEMKEYEVGQEVIREGEEGNEFFLILSGEAAVYKGDVNIATLKPGDYFGEASLLEDTPRNATIKVPENAAQRLRTLSITRAKFEELGVRERLVFPRRRAVAADSDDGPRKDNDNTVKITEKGPEQEVLIRKALMNNKYLSKVLADEQISDMVAKAWKLDVKAGVAVIEEGSLQADRFYIVSSGYFTVKKMMEKTTTAGGVSMEDGLLTELEAGSTFGELALLYNAPRAATVEANTDASLWVIDRHDFKQILRQQVQRKFDFYMKLIGKIELLSYLLQEEKRALVECFVELHYKEGQEIIKEGDTGNTFYILCQGTVGIYKDGEGKVAEKVADATNSKCPHFGEKALLDDEPRNATVKVESPSAFLLVLERSTFESILGPLKVILENEKTSKRKSFAYRNNISHGRSDTVANFKAPKFSDLQKIGLLGCGGFGSVRLVRDRNHKDKTFALKQISKGYVVKMQLCDQICNERKILSMTSSPFIAQFYCTYNEKENLYFLLEPCLGGEVFAVYNAKKFHGEMKHCQFYSACVVKAFEHLHERRIIYRDLKPENMLLTNDGYCKLTDMGLAKFVIGRTYTTCGTPDYFAPEIVQSAGHTNAVDWWTFGILVYELLKGHPPFDGLDPMARYKKILVGVTGVAFPSSRFSPDVKDMIQRVCKSDPKKRLPMLPGGPKANLYTHNFYQEDFSWEELEKRTLVPPYKPRVKRPDDMSNFRSSEDECPPNIPYIDPGTGWDSAF